LHRAKEGATLAIDRFDRIRALVADGESYYDLPVTDLRLYEMTIRRRGRPVFADMKRKAGARRSVIVAWA